MTDISIPNHLAIIMDGNGRWAKSKFLPRVAGHKKGADVVSDVVTLCADMGVKYLTLYTFSTENWLRPKDEVSFLMDLLYTYLDKEIKRMAEKNVRFVVSGRLDLLPERSRNKVYETVEKLSKNTGMVLNLALSYGGRNEIVDAMKNIAVMVKDGQIDPEAIDDDMVAANLYNPEIPDIDLVIRTSGERRISNFMLWRAAYSEFYFTDCLWPDFGKEELETAIADFSGRVRRFGMTDEQVSKERG